MLQKQLNQAKVKIADLATQLKLLPPKREIFGEMMGYEFSSPVLSQGVAAVVAVKNEKISIIEDLEEFEEVAPLTIPVSSPTEKVIDETDIVQAFYNIATILNYALVENQLATAKALAIGDLSPWGKNKDTYKEELANQLNEAFIILFHAKLENKPKFLPLVHEIQNIAVTIISEVESLFDTINGFIVIEKFKFPAVYKNSAKSFLTALQFIFEAAARYQTVNQLTNELEAKLANHELNNDQKIQLIQNTQVDILLAFFGQQKNIDGRESIFGIEKLQLNENIKNVDFNNIKKTINELLECFISSEATLTNLNLLRRYSIVNTVAKQFTSMFNHCLVELPKSILTLQEKIIELEKSNTYDSPIDDGIVINNLEELGLEEQVNEALNKENDTEKSKQENTELEKELVVQTLDSPVIAQPEIENLPEENNFDEHQQKINEVNTYTQEELPVIELITINSTLNNEDATTEKFKQETLELKEEPSIPRIIIIQTETEKLSEKTNLEKHQQGVDEINTHTQKGLPVAGSIISSDLNNAKKSPEKIDETDTNSQEELLVGDSNDYLNNKESTQISEIVVESIVLSGQTETHVDTPPLTVLDVINYISLFLIFTIVGVGIGFAIGGIGGAIAGGILGAMVGEIAILDLEDKRTAVISPVEDQPLKHNRNNLVGNSKPNEALKFNQGNIYSVSKQELKSVTQSENKYVNPPYNVF